MPLSLLAASLEMPASLLLHSDVAATSLLTGLPLHSADPVFARYAGQSAGRMVPIVGNPVWVSALRFAQADAPGGAVVLLACNGRVLAMDYADDDDLEAAWVETLESYAPTRRRISLEVQRSA